MVMYLDIYHFLFHMQQEKKNVWLDCDPGLDDTLAIILAARSPHINLLGLSTSAGNTNINNTTKNSLDILFNVRRSDVIVVRGSEKLIAGQAHLAEHMHGSGGLGGITIPSTNKSPITENNFKTIRDHIMDCPSKVIWANTGALTNLCVLFRQHPEVKTKIQQIVIMGGAIGKGNITPAAEFNIYFDPVAFKQVLENKQKIPLVMIPLEVTHQVQAREKIFKFLQHIKQTPILKAIYAMLKSYQKMYQQSSQKFEYPPVHDPTVINYILHPSNFELRKAIIDVDVGKCSYGRTNCYFNYPTDPKKQIDSVDSVAVKMSKRNKFWEMFEKIFEKLSEEEQTQ